ncbi:hypothetical protein RSO01_28750 [Reyranella soli]|uniref:DUF3300 domain-containing protein n=2 Tax=Reyranella soli TaxID=1230389 RepID=A0A512N9Q3_9HYPH|nr:hypothetical protein RSO01_28750 [Reyranella soli]
MTLAATVAGTGLAVTASGWAVAQTAPTPPPPSNTGAGGGPTGSPTGSSSGGSTVGTASPATSAAGTASGSQPFTAAQLDQLLAPIALYPDALLAQTLMAATYPLEVVEAARWSKDNPNLKGDAALAAVKDEGWDVSVTSLVAFPQVLAMMNSQLDWTQKIGDAMIAQQPDVAASIQRLRAQAQSAGTLKSTAQQTVAQQPASAGAPAGTPAAIVIQPTNPDTVYVPAYDPSWAYGSWPYADNPPSYFPPTGYGWGGFYGGGWSGGFSFGLGFSVGGGFFGGWSWGGGWGGGWGWGGWGGWGRGNSYTTININRATYITNNFNRNIYHDGRWNHDPAHRHGVPYRDRDSRERYDQHHPDAAQRQAFRGRLDHPTDAGQRGNENRGAAGRATEGRGGENRGGENRDGENRGGENRAGENRGGEYRGGENRAGENRGGDYRGAENRGRENSHALSSANHGRQVHREASRGQAYRGHPNFSHASHVGHGGGGHRGGHGGRR